MTSTTANVPASALFARLPAGRSMPVRVLLILGGLLTGASVFWIRHLRFDGKTHDLAPVFLQLFRDDDYGAAMLALGILVLALFVPRLERLHGLLRWIGEHPYRLGAIASVLISAGTLTVYHNHPLSMDEYAALFQAQVFAAGHLAGHFPPALLDALIPKTFQNFFFALSRTTGEVSSKYWPSFALLLTPFTKLGIPWACNAVLSGATLVVLNRLALRLFQNVEAAGLVVLLTIASPVFFADGISYYSMTAHLLANAVFALLMLEPTARRLFAAGVVGSIALTLHNPVPHTLFALPWFVWLAGQEKPVPKLAALCAGYLPLSLLLGLGWFWHLVQLAHDGGPATQGVGSLGDIATAFGFPTGTVLYARLIGLTKILLWASPCLLLLTFAGARRGARDSRLLTLAACGALTFVGYLFVPPDQGHGWGFRYFHSAWLVLPLLATAFIFEPAKPQPPSTARADVMTFIAACAVLSLFTAIPLRASQIDDFMRNHLSQYPDYSGTEPRVVVQNGAGFYAFDLVQNDPFLRSDLVRMGTIGPDETAAAIQRQFPAYHLVFTDDYGDVWSAAPPVKHAVPRH